MVKQRSSNSKWRGLNRSHLRRTRGGGADRLVMPATGQPSSSRPLNSSLGPLGINARSPGQPTQKKGSAQIVIVIQKNGPRPLGAVERAMPARRPLCYCFVLELPIASARHSPARLSVPRPASPCHECKVLPKPLSRGPEPNLYALTLCPRLCSPLSRAMTREQSTAAAEEASPPTPTDPCATRTCVCVCMYANACTCVCAGVCVGVCVWH